MLERSRNFRAQMLFEGYRARGPKLPARCTLPGALNSAEPCSRFWIVVLFLACFWASVADELLIQVVSWAVSQSQSIRFIHRAADPVGVRCTVCVCVFFFIFNFFIGSQTTMLATLRKPISTCRTVSTRLPAGCRPQKKGFLKSGQRIAQNGQFRGRALGGYIKTKFARSGCAGEIICPTKHPKTSVPV